MMTIAWRRLADVPSDDVYQAPEGASEGWVPSPFPRRPFVAFAHDGGLDWIRGNYAAAAAGDPTGIAQSCRANAP